MSPLLPTCALASPQGGYQTALTLEPVMSSPDPESMSLLAKVVAAGVAVATPITWLWTKLDKKADKHSVNNVFNEIKLEQKAYRETLQEDLNRGRAENREEHKDFRETMRELFKNAEADRKDTSAKLDRMSKEMHDMHVELLNKIGANK